MRKMSQSQKKEECSQVLFIQCWWQPCQICKKCFLVTLGISETFANHAFKNQQGGVYVGEDRRVNMHLITRQ